MRDIVFFFPQYKNTPPSRSIPYHLSLNGGSESFDICYLVRKDKANEDANLPNPNDSPAFSLVVTTYS